jgi:hypothetical protein
MLPQLKSNPVMLINFEQSQPSKNGERVKESHLLRMEQMT